MLSLLIYYFGYVVDAARKSDKFVGLGVDERSESKVVKVRQKEVKKK